MSVQSRMPSPWKTKNKAYLFAGVLLLIAFSSIKLAGLGIWLLTALAAKGWPSSEQFMMTVGFDSKKTERAKKIEVHGMRGMGWINPGVLGIGSPGESEDTEIDWRNPLRLSSIMNLLAAAAGAWAITLIPLERLLLETNAPSWGWYYEIPLFAINALFIYVNLQQIAASFRQFKDEEAMEAIHPPVQYDPDIKDMLERNDYLKMAASFLIPLLVVLGLTFFFTNSIPSVIKIAPTAALLALIIPIHRFWKISRPIVHEQFEYNIAQKKKWSGWWDYLPSYKGASPDYLFETNEPRQDPTHKSITFSVAAGESGVRPFMDEKVVKGLMTLVQSDTILITPYERIIDGMMEKGSAQEAAFKLTYPLVEGNGSQPEGSNMDAAAMLGTKYHLKKEVDRTTMAFYAQAVFQTAFRSLKIPQPVFAGLTPLTKPDSENTIIETKWNIEDSGITYSKLHSMTNDLQGELGVQWLRVGRQIDSNFRAEAAKPSRLASIVYSLDGKPPTDPSTIFASPRHANLALGLEWSWQMSSLKIPELIMISDKPLVKGEINMATWKLPEGYKYADIAKHTESIKEKMGVPWLRISDPTTDFGDESPANMVLFYSGRNPIPQGREKPLKFRNKRDEQKVQQLNWIHLLRQLDWKYFGMRIEKTIDHSEEQNRKLLETVWHLPDGVTYIDILKQRDRFAEKFGTPFFEIYRRSTVPKNSNWIDESYASIIFGDTPGEPIVNGTDIQYPGVAEKSAKYLNTVLWGTAFKKVDLIDTDGTTPVVTLNIEKPLGVTVTTFQKIGKLSEDDFEKRLPNLKTALKVMHMRIDYAKEANSFIIEHALKDPLANNFDFDDYKQGLLMAAPPTPGTGKLKFGLGIGSTGEIVEMAFDSGSPHICIGASSGSGKSYLLRAILLSWFYNNDPDTDLWMLLIEPKKGLEGYAKYPHVKCFIGNDTPSYQQVPEFTNEDTGVMEVDPLIVGASDIYDWLTEEMKRREQIFKKYEFEWGIRIEKLQDAREAALQHMKENDLEHHELLLPFIVMAAEEAPQFMRELRTGGSVGKVKAGMVADIRRLSEAVSQRARATGIVLLNVSQNFKNELFPIEVKNNSRVVGLTTNTPRASINIWGDDTLHNLGKPGRGILNDQDTGDLIDFRAFFVPMGEVEDHDGEKVQMRDYFAENLGHLELREEALNGWDDQLIKMYRPKYAQTSDAEVTRRGIPAPSDFVSDSFNDEF